VVVLCFPSFGPIKLGTSSGPDARNSAFPDGSGHATTTQHFPHIALTGRVRSPVEHGLPPSAAPWRMDIQPGINVRLGGHGRRPSVTADCLTATSGFSCASPASSPAAIRSNDDVYPFSSTTPHVASDDSWAGSTPEYPCAARPLRRIRGRACESGLVHDQHAR